MKCIKISYFTAKKEGKTMTIQDAVAAYIHKLENDSPIVSTSHAHYAAYAKMFGDDAWQKALDEYFDSHKKKG